MTGMNTDVWTAVKPGESIYEFVVSNTGLNQEFDDSAGDLPDENRTDPERIRYAPGAKEGIFGSEKPYPAIEVRVARIAKLMMSASNRPSRRTLMKLYEAIAEFDSVDLADPLAAALQRAEADKTTVHRIGRWLAVTGVDRSVVKIGIMILGITGLGDDIDIVQALGRHEEFTLYSAVSIANGVPDSELPLWNLAQSVHGWGRVHTVRRLNNAKDPAVRRWILREGFRNSVMDEELAYIAATVGDLNGSLRKDDVDRELLTAAGEIFTALTSGEPFKGLEDYADGDEAVEAYLLLVARRAESLTDFLAVKAIERFLESEHDWDALSHNGWTATRREVFERECKSILGWSKWENIVRAELLSQDGREFFLADQAAQDLGIDTYAFFLRKIIDDPLGSSWYRAWKQADDLRAIELTSLARNSLPLKAIGTGPASSLGLGKDWQPHQALNWTLQALRDHVGVGGDLVLVGLRSPVIRNRNMSLNVLKKWPQDSWPKDAVEMLKETATNEPNQRTRELALEILADAED
jgi:hypothetical protein